MAYKFTAVTALVHNDTVIIDVFAKAGLNLLTPTGFAIKHSGSDIRDTLYSTYARDTREHTRTTITIPLKALGKGDKTGNITLSILYLNTSIDVQYISLDRLTYLYEDAVSNIADLDYSVKFDSEPSSNLYTYTVAVTSRKASFSANNLIYFTAKDYFITNSNTSLINVNPEILERYDKTFKGFIGGVNASKSFIGSIGELGHGLHPGKDGTGGTGGAIYLFLDIKEPPLFDVAKPILKVCSDTHASNNYLVSPWSTGCTTQNSINNFANQAAADSAEDTYTLIEDLDCCTYANDTDEGFDVNITSYGSPDNQIDSGFIDFEWVDGTPPFDLNFICPPSDSTCSNSNFDATNTYATTLAVTLLSGTTLSSESYTLTVTDANNLEATQTLTGLVSLNTQLTVNCQDASSINYNAAGVSESGVCKWCDSNSGLVITTAADQNGMLPVYRYNPATPQDMTTLPSTAFTVLPFAIVPATAANNDGSGAVNVLFNVISESSAGIGYSFHLWDSVEIDGSGGSIKVERKTMYSDYTSKSVFEAAQTGDSEDGALIWAASTSEATPVLHAVSVFTQITTNLMAGLAGGSYIYKMSYTDSNSSHEIEDCFVYYAVEITRAGCTDPTAQNYVGVDEVSTGLYVNEGCYEQPDVTLNSVVQDMLIWDLAYINTDAMSDCEFDMYTPFQFTNIQSPTVATFTGLYTLQASSSILQLAILYEYYFRAFGIQYIPEGVYISYFDYDLVYYTIDEDGQSVANTVVAQQDTSETAYGVSQAATKIALNANWSANGAYNFKERTSFGTTLNSVTSDVGVQSATIALQVTSASGLVGSSTINLLAPNGPQVFSINDVAIAGVLSDYLTGANLCNDCESAFELMNPGCTDASACNFNPSAQTDDGTCAGYVGGSPAIDGTGGWTSAAGNFGIPCGCTDPAYQEFSSVSLEFVTEYPEYGAEVLSEGAVESACQTAQVTGCMDSLYVNYNAYATESDDSCSDLIVLGCTVSTACNYNEEANTDNGTCYYNLDEAACADFDNWELISQVAPYTCAGEDTSSGSFVLTNSNFSGPVSFRFFNTNNTLAITEGSSLILQGVNYLGLSAVVDNGSFLSEQGINNGVTITSLQSLGGTTFSVTNIDAGMYEIHIMSGEYPTVEVVTCICEISNIDGTLIADFNSGEGSGMVEGTAVFRLNITAANARAIGDNGACGCCDPTSGTYDPEIDPVNGNGACNQSLCADYGCTDPEANNYNEFASLACTDPNTQLGASGVRCSPCKYGFIDNLYTPAFCMPAKTEQQLKVIRKCIGTAGTNAYISTLTGKSDCVTRDAWKLILIEYLMSKKGLDCIYNCADAATPSMEGFESCGVRANGKVIQEHLAIGIPAGTTRNYYVGDTWQYKYTAQDTGPKMYYTLKYLEESDSGYVHPTHVTILDAGNVWYSSMSPSEVDYLQYSPGIWPGWVLCEEPPTKPHNKDYIGKFINFVQSYCRQCQLPVSPNGAGRTVEVESVITINGIVITVNNSNLK